MNLNTTQRHSINLWFVCTSCKFTFFFPTVDEFLEHKKEKHFVEFQKAQCIVFEERKQDEFLSRFHNTEEISDIKLFPQGQDQDGHGNVDVSLFLECSSSVDTSTLLDPRDRDPEADLILGDRTHTGHETQSEQIQLPVENNSIEDTSYNDFSPDPDPDPDPGPDPDVSFADSGERSDSGSCQFQIDPLSENVLNESNNSTLLTNTSDQLKTPTVLLRRLTSTELSSCSRLPISSRQNKRKIKLSAKKTKLNTSKKAKKTKTNTKEDGGVPRPFVCTVCRRSFDTKQGLNFHMKFHYGFKSEGPLPFKCTYPDCRASFANEINLKCHTERHENASSNPRSTINKPFFKFPEPEPEPDSDTGPNQSDPLTFREWLMEQKSLENSNSFDAETVNIIRLDPDPAEMDETDAEAFKISGETPIKCKLCNKNLESVPQVKVHVTHCWLLNKLRHVYCLPCNKSVSKPLALRIHNTRKHGGKRKKSKLDQFLCSLCPKMTKTESHLKRHMESHKSKEERVKPWVCEVCGLAYSEQFKLKNHQMIHGEESRFRCPHSDCDMAFKTKMRLSSHLRNHFDAKSYSCPKEGCSKTFKRQYGLVAHLKTRQHSQKIAQYQ